MSLHWLKLNLRTRLTAILTLTVSISLGLVFAIVLAVVREQAVSRRFGELENNVKRIAKEWRSPDALNEVEDDFPGLEIAVFKESGGLLASTTRRSIERVVGRQKRGEVLLFGFNQGNISIVGISSWTETEAGLRQLTLVLALLWLPLVALTACVAWYGGGLVMKPVSELVASAERLSENTKTGHLKTPDGAEFEALVNSLNQLIDGVRRAASLQEQFAADAAHELRTPLALLQTRIEVNLQKERSVEEHVLAQQAMLRQIERLASIVDALLSTARTRDVRPTQPVDFANAVRTAANDWVELVQWPRSSLVMEIEECACSMSIDETGLILRNLLDNAARYAPDGTPIELRVTCAGMMADLTVRDYGPGLRKDEMQLAFERFYRADESRDRQQGGAGIGLAIVKRIIESHGGNIAFEPIDVGALVRLKLPLCS